MNVREVSAPKVDFSRNNPIEWDFTFATEPIINSFFNNKEKVNSDSVRKDSVAEFKWAKR